MKKKITKISKGQFIFCTVSAFLLIALLFGMSKIAHNRQDKIEQKKERKEEVEEIEVEDIETERIEVEKNETKKRRVMYRLPDDYDEMTKSQKEWIKDIFKNEYGFTKAEWQKLKKNGQLIRYE